MMHAIAESRDSEGILIQESRGDVRLLAPDQQRTAASPFRLMSWRPDAAFAIATQHSYTGIYTDTPLLDPAPDAHAALEVGSGAGGKWGIISWLASIVRP